MTSIRSRTRRRTRRRVLPLGAASIVLILGLGAFTGSAGAAAPWLWPVEPARVIHGFDPPEDPWGSGHRGVDLAGTVGQAVTAPAAGTVTFAGLVAGRGVVVVSHGAIRTTYEPIDSGVTVGAAVEGGDTLGTLQGFAHHCSSPCLHWGAIRGAVYVDPTSFVVVPPSRLLPVWEDNRLGRDLGANTLAAIDAADQRLAGDTVPAHRPGVDRPSDGEAPRANDATERGRAIEPVPAPDGAAAADGSAVPARASPRSPAPPDTRSGAVGDATGAGIAAVVAALVGGVFAGYVLVRLLWRRR